jgi:putative transposase
MLHDSLGHHRRSIRLRGYDYTQPGQYFVTLCIKDRKCILGDVVRNEMRLTRIGEIVEECWEEIPEHFSNTLLDEFVVMPNHMHGIIVLVGTRHAVSRLEEISPPSGERFGGPVSGSLSTIIRSFKSAASHRIHSEGFPTFCWQARFYEHIIRGGADLDRIRRYITNNPKKWSEQSENSEDNPMIHRTSAGS